MLSLFRIPFLLLIRLYQKTLSMDHGLPSKLFPYGFCRFTPTCSEYSYRAIERHGVIRGIALAIWRIIRCNPFSKGGCDPVPEEKKWKTSNLLSNNK
jgi:hypothetical protein